MAKYVDLVLARHDTESRCATDYLFEAPSWTYLNAGDEIMVDTKNGIAHATVEAVCTVTKDSSEYWFIVKACKAYAPLRRVLSRVMYREFTYEDEEENEDE